MSAGRTQAKDEDRHFGLVVDDRAPLRRALEAAGAEILPGRGLDFIDPWGNHIQVVEYRDIQFTKAPEVLAAMELGGLEKSEDALQELAEKGIRPDRDPSLTSSPGTCDAGCPPSRGQRLYHRPSCGLWRPIVLTVPTVPPGGMRGRAP